MHVSKVVAMQLLCHWLGMLKLSELQLTALSVKLTERPTLNVFSLMQMKVTAVITLDSLWIWIKMGLTNFNLGRN